MWARARWRCHSPGPGITSCTDWSARSCRRSCRRSGCRSRTHHRKYQACCGQSGWRLWSCSWVSASRRTSFRGSRDPSRPRPPRDTGRAWGDVVREVVGRDLHATGTEERDPDPRKLPPEFRALARARVVLDGVACHLEAAYGFGFEGFEEHAGAVVVDGVSGNGAAVGVLDVDAPRAARDVVANNLRVRGFLACHVGPHDTGTAHIVGEDLGPGRVNDEHAEPVAYEIIPRDGGVGGPVNIERVLAVGVTDDVLRDSGVGTVLNSDA